MPVNVNLYSSLPFLPGSLKLPGPPSQSVFLPPRTSSVSRHDNDSLAALARQAAYVQRTLQELLDAQSDGLSAGLGRPTARDHDPITPNVGREQEGAPIRPYTDSPSRSPDSGRSAIISRPSRRSTKVIPVRQPLPPPKLTLREARQGILQSLQTLADLKDQELGILDKQVESSTDFLTTIDGLNTKRSDVQNEIAKISDESTHGQQGIHRLKTEEQALKNEIHELENKLYELKARLGYVEREREEHESHLQSELSSWKNTLREVDKDIDTRVLSGLMYYTPKDRAKDSVWALPKDRRTLSMVKDHLSSEKASLETLRLSTEAEGTACLHGAEHWQAVVMQVSAVETRLKRELSTLSSASPSQIASPTAGSPRPHPNDANRGMQAVLDLMARTIPALETALSHAEDNGWSLLVCAIGAELAALREGHDMLRSALAGSRPQDRLESAVREQSQERSLESLQASMYTAKESPAMMASGFAAARGAGVRTSVGKQQLEHRQLVDVDGEEEGEEKGESELHDDTPPPDLLFVQSEGEEDDMLGRERLVDTESSD